ncbi:MAG TPA: hypothetical protein VEY51_01285 [Chondromyces sp.]|nr:hypothetical protein [Chondromyces sp.]
MLYVILFLLIVAAVSLFRRYFPVKGVRHIEKEHEIEMSEVTVLDIRDYNEISEEEECDSLNIPYAYLNRYYTEIPCKTIHVVAADKTELNLGLRFLIRKGFQVQSFSLMDKMPLH